MQNKKITTAMVRKEYQQQIALYARMIPDAGLRLRVTLSADNYFRNCAISVWGRGDGVTEAHVDAYNAICSKGSAAPGALYFEVMSRVADRPAFATPVFYDGLVNCDRVHGTHLVREFCQMCQGLLLLFAAVDDLVTQQEADYVEDCVRYLREGKPMENHGFPDKQELADLLEHMNSLVENAPVGQQTQQQPSQLQAEEEAIQPEPSTEELLQELDQLCGLDQVKKDVHSMVNLIKVRRLRQENGLPVPPMSLHLVFLGNPGTGKTTVARLLARLYKSIGVLKQGQLVETDRSGLVAGYVGQTATKTKEVVQKALGGVLFIDEAYALTNHGGENDFGHEAIEVILKSMEDFRDNLIVIVAGYQELMQDFIRSNPGLASRFNKYFFFEDYNGGQLMQIFMSLCEKNGYKPDDRAEAYATDYFDRLFRNRDENFGNARDVRNVFEALVVAQSDRVGTMEAPTVEDLMQVTVEDFCLAVEEEAEKA